MEIREFRGGRGGSPFVSWFNDLDAQAAAKVTVALPRMERGNLGNTKGVGGGVQEYQIDWDPATGCISGRMGTC
jgi:putative component of toxin-antitoxin plasmid stabilization module